MKWLREKLTRMRYGIILSDYPHINLNLGECFNKSGRKSTNISRVFVKTYCRDFAFAVSQYNPLLSNALGTTVRQINCSSVIQSSSRLIGLLEATRHFANSLTPDNAPGILIRYSTSYWAPVPRLLAHQVYWRS